MVLSNRRGDNLKTWSVCLALGDHRNTDDLGLTLQNRYRCGQSWTTLKLDALSENCCS